MTTNRIIELLGSIRADYNCFDENEREKYEALSEAIRKLKPRREYTKLVPCVCGGKRRITWYHTVKDGISYECIKCGRSSPLGETKEEARKNWNEYISKLKGETDDN